MFNELKNSIRRWVLPIAAKIPLSPNALTVIGLVVSLLAALMFAWGEIVLGGFLIILSGIFDILDGAVARASGTKTAFGGVLDSVCDRYADALIFSGIMYGSIYGSIMPATLFEIPVWLWCMISVIGSYLVSYTRARAEAAGTPPLNVGIAERSERMIILVIGAFTGYIAHAIVIVAVLTHITIIQRIMSAKESLE
ncbi:MAG: CDP-alcohol phosphatidyltransferase family protein [Methanosarcinaceae archaeon]|nr:CDP-alcohol phosphatidyltransferase family protein [Methanosarcinaceae archaeon]